MATRRALQQDPPHRPSLRLPAQRTAKAVRPSQPYQVLATGVVRTETRIEFGLGPGIILHGPEHYILGSPESRGYQISGDSSCGSLANSQCITTPCARGSVSGHSLAGILPSTPFARCGHLERDFVTP
jgi:hypothetical protein